MIRGFVSAFLSSRFSRHIISRLPTQQSQKLKSPLPIQALQRTKHKTKSTKVTIVRFFLTSNKSVSQLPTNIQKTNLHNCFSSLYAQGITRNRKTETFGFGFARVGGDACWQILVAHRNCECWQSAFNIVDATATEERQWRHAVLYGYICTCTGKCCCWHTCTSVQGVKPSTSNTFVTDGKWIYKLLGICSTVQQ
jgi:hypothetical protein